MDGVSGSIAVVTGASSGLGRRFCVDLARAGAVVVGVARRAELLKTLAGELQASSPHSSVRVCDITDTSALTSLLAEVEDENRRIDLLVNDAGVGEQRGAEGITPYRAVMETNFFAAVAATLAVLPGMMARGAGIVVNVSSDSGRAPGPGEPAYGASKAALSAFTESMSMRTEGTGVRLHVLYPGWVPTDMGSGAVAEGMPIPPRAVRRSEEQVSRLLMRRMGGSKVDIDAAAVGRLAPAVRALAPRLYRRGVMKASR